MTISDACRAGVDQRERRRSLTGRRGTPWLVFLMALAVYLSTGQKVNTGDAVATSLIPITLLQHGTVRLDEFTSILKERYHDAITPGQQLPYFIEQTPRGVVSYFPIGAGLLATPVLALPILVIASTTSPSTEEWLDRAQTLQFYAAAIITAATASLFWLICEKFRVPFLVWIGANRSLCVRQPSLLHELANPMAAWAWRPVFTSRAFLLHPLAGGLARAMGGKPVGNPSLARRRSRGCYAANQCPAGRTHLCACALAATSAGARSRATGSVNWCCPAGLQCLFLRFSLWGVPRVRFRHRRLEPRGISRRGRGPAVFTWTRHIFLFSVRRRRVAANFAATLVVATGIAGRACRLHCLKHGAVLFFQ